MCHSVYILECEDGSYYIGYSTDVQKRFKKHLSGKGAKYTRSHKPKSILVTFPCSTKSEALKLEYQLKQLTHEQKKNFLVEYTRENKSQT